MHALMAMKLHAKRWLFPDAARVTEEPLTPIALSEKFHRVMFNGITSQPFASLDEAILAVEAGMALESILLTYRAGRAQSAEERELGRALDYVARTYLRA